MGRRRAQLLSAQTPRRRYAWRTQLAIASTGLQFGLEGLQFDNTAARNFSSGGKGQEDVVMTLATIDVPPKPLQRSAAAYPSRARRSGIEGHVTLSMLISREGDVQDVMVVRAKPSGNPRRKLLSDSGILIQSRVQGDITLKVVRF